MIRFHYVAAAGFYSGLIAWWGNGWHGFSHVDCMMSDGTLIGARSDWITPLGSHTPIRPGVQRRPSGYETWLRTMTVTVPSTDAETKQWESFIIGQIGMQYDPFDIVDLIAGRKTEEESGHWICSAFATESLIKIGRISSLCTPPQQVTPDGHALITSSMVGATTDLPKAA